jgi:GTPase SAR1 family protein
LAQPAAINLATDGIEITSSTFIARKAKDKKDKEKKYPEKLIRLSIYDFAGQAVYYATHQFFLTPFSIYILVYNMMDLTQAEMRLEFWIHSIKSHVPHPQIILVATHHDESNSAMVERSKVMCQKFAEAHKNVKFLTPWVVSCIRDGYNIDELRNYLVQQIYDYLNEAKDVPAELPSSYLLFEQLVKEYRHGLSLPVISQNELVRIGVYLDYYDVPQLV